MIYPIYARPMYGDTRQLSTPYQPNMSYLNLKKGAMQFANNSSILHARAGFTIPGAK